MNEQAFTAANEEYSVQRRARFADFAFDLIIGTETRRIAVRHGRVALVDREGASDFTLQIDPEAWEIFGQDVPPPGYHDFAALAENGHATVTGDFLPVFRYLFLLRDLLSHLRRGKAAA